jgi:hypothetical protein
MPARNVPPRHTHYSPVSRKRKVSGCLLVLASVLLVVAVGMPVTRHPPPRSRRAALPHRALASGRDAQALRRIRLQDMGCGEPWLGQCIYPLPRQPMPLTASTSRPTPVPHDRFVAHCAQTAVAGDSLGAVVPQQDPFQTGSLARDGPGHTQPPSFFDILQFLA